MRTRALLAPTITAILLAACTARAPERQPGSSNLDLRGVALKVNAGDGAADTWTRFHQFLSSVSGGAVCNSWQLDKAVYFFERASGIQSRLIGSYGGRVLDHEVLRHDLQRWDAWYTTNGPAFDTARIVSELQSDQP